MHGCATGADKLVVGRVLGFIDNLPRFPTSREKAFRKIVFFRFIIAYTFTVPIRLQPSILVNVESGDPT